MQASTGLAALHVMLHVRLLEDVVALAEEFKKPDEQNDLHLQK